MEKLSFKIDINAPREVVWDVLWNKATYPQWTSIFGEGSRAISDWKEGSKIFFLSSDKNGMYGIIERLIPYTEMTFRHIGIISGGVEQPTGEQTAEWDGSLESYFLSDHDGVSVLTAVLHTTEDSTKYFQDTFPQALQKVKQLSEQVPASV